MSKTIQLMQEQTAEADAFSQALDLNDLMTASFQITFTGGGGDIEGDLALQGSLNGVDFFDYPGSQQAVTASTGHIYDLTPTGVPKFRVRWDYASGTGDMKILVFIKGPGQGGV